MAVAPSSVSLPVRRGIRLAVIPQWWHLLSLDAPTVAALWSWSIARALGVHLPWTAPLLLALGTWLVYVADRILDGMAIHSSGDSCGHSSGAARRKSEGALHERSVFRERHVFRERSALRERHFFYARHRGAFLMASVPAVLLLGWLIVNRMKPTARHEDVAVFAVALLYFCIVHIYGPRVERWLPKELAVGLVFAAATAVPAWSRLRTGHLSTSSLSAERALLIATVFLFAALCWLNCVAIEKWERRSDAEQVTAIPHWTTLWAQPRLQRLCTGIAVTSAMAAVAGWLAGESAAVPAIFLACALTAAGFAALDRGRERWPVSAFCLRIAADAVMLTPLIFLLIPL